MATALHPTRRKKEKLVKGGPFDEFVELLYKYPPDSPVIDAFLCRHARDPLFQRIAPRVREIFRNREFQHLQQRYLRWYP